MAIEGYQDILYLIGLTFGKRDFFEVADHMIAEAPYGDLTSEQRATFEAVIKHSVVRQYVALWWAIYDNLRATGEIPPTTPWKPSD